jgi:heterodisulfide reductase subunit C
MDVTPNQVMRLVQIGDCAAADKVLRSGAIWSCAGCLICTQRCPKELDPAAVMDALREISYQQGKVSPEQKKVLAFHEAFLTTVEKTGRMSEFALVRRYKTATMDLLSDLAVAPALMARGKLKLTGHKIAGRKEVQRIFRACRKRGNR